MPQISHHVSLFLVIAGTMLGGSRQGNAMSCRQIALAEKVAEASHVFVGTVSVAAMATDDTMIATFAVEVPLKGRKLAKLELRYRGSAWTGIPDVNAFAPRSRHLVFAFDHGSHLEMGMGCGITATPEASSKADLAAIPALVASDAKLASKVRAALAEADKELAGGQPARATRALKGLAASGPLGDELAIARARALAREKKFAEAMALNDATAARSLHAMRRAEALYNNLCSAALSKQVPLVYQYANALLEELRRQIPDADEPYFGARIDRFAKLMAKDPDLASLRNLDVIKSYTGLLEEIAQSAKTPLAERRRRLAKAKALVAAGKCEAARALLDGLESAFLLLRSSESEEVVNLGIKCEKI